MVEGHQCHRLAHFHRKQLLGRAFTASSPNGRFVAGAAAISGLPLSRIEVHGKNLFYFFGDPAANPVVLHYHFGMSGAFSVHSLAAAPAPTKTTRLRLVSEADDVAAHLSAMIVVHGGPDLYHGRIATLGEDPLRGDADPEAAWAKVSASKRPVGGLLMDQSVIAGVGNIYRAEILYKAGVHPEQPGSSLPRPVFDAIWRHAVALLQRGFQTGSILTVDEQEAKVLGAPWTRRYIYNQASCGRCGGAALAWDMYGRTAYACGGACQPLRPEWMPGGMPVLGADRRRAFAAARRPAQFVSHCAPDDVYDADTPLGKLPVAALRKRAEAAGLPASGTKAALVARLQAAAAVKKEEESEEDARPSEVPTPAPKAKRARAGGDGSPLPRGGTQGLGRVATAAEAAREKLAAGEGRGVEHVALHDDEEAAVIDAAAPRRRRART